MGYLPKAKFKDFIFTVSRYSCWVEREYYNKGTMILSQKEYFSKQFGNYNKTFAKVIEDMEAWVSSNTINRKRNRKSKDEKVVKDQETRIEDENHK